jgi:signal transduction histidine kinase
MMDAGAAMAKPRHRLLERQLRMARRAGNGGPLDIATLLDLVSQAYEEQDNIVKLNGHATNLMSEELMEANTRLRADIARRETVEAQLVEARDAALAADRAKTEFLANMSHELRTPLNAIIGFSEMMDQKILGPLDSPPYEEYVGDILHAGRHLLAIINDVLDMARVEAKALRMNFRPLDPRTIIEDCLRLLRPEAEAAQLTLEGDFASDLPAIKADPTRLRQVVVNLVCNAVKFTPAGGRVTVSASSGPDGVKIRIADTGIGMTEEEVEIARQPFRQVGSVYSRNNQGGAGLGLPIAKALVELHGGTLAITSRKGAGTVVSATLPLARADTPNPLA